MKREIIKIDEDKCTGCGLCIPACPEGALQIIDGKVRLVSDLMCDGLGACLGECPEDAIEVEVREAEPYNEKAVMAIMVEKGLNTVSAHIEHLEEHGEHGFIKEAFEYLHEHESELSFTMDELKGSLNKQKNNTMEDMKPLACGCPGSAMQDFREEPNTEPSQSIEGEVASELRQWPVQMHLINPNAPYFQGADVVLAADCVAFTYGDFHRKYLQGKSLAIACPKLDQQLEVYVDKLVSMIDQARINTLHVMVMQVPCCSGLLQIAQTAINQAERKIPIKKTVVGVQGDILSEDWI